MTIPVFSSPLSRDSEEVREAPVVSGAPAIWASSSRVAVGTPLHRPVPELASEGSGESMPAGSTSMSAWLSTAMVPHEAPVMEQADSTRRRSASGTRRELVRLRAA